MNLIRYIPPPLPINALVTPLLIKTVIHEPNTKKINLISVFKLKELRRLTRHTLTHGIFLVSAVRLKSKFTMFEKSVQIIDSTLN